MQRYLIAGFVWGLFAFATTGKWYAPMVMAGIFAVLYLLIESVDNVRAVRTGKPRPNPYPTFGALSTICCGALVALATWFGR